MKIEFIVPGNPVGKARPRHTKSGHTYTPEKTTTYENLVKLMYSQKYKGVVFDTDVPLAISIEAYIPIPQSVSKKKADMMKQNTLLPTKKPDCDNIAKIICDALNGVAYPDDKQIVSMLVSKRYSDNPYVKISIWDVREETVCLK